MPNVPPWAASKARAQIHAAQAADEMVAQQDRIAQTLDLVLKEQQSNTILVRVGLYIVIATFLLAALPYLLS